MTTLEEMKQQRTALQEAVTSGTLSVRHGDKSVTYQSTDSMLKALSRLEAMIRRAEGGPRRRFVYQRNKGL